MGLPLKICSHNANESQIHGDKKPSQTLSELPQTTVSNNRVIVLCCVRKDILVAVQNKWKRQMYINTFFNKIT